MMYSQRANIGFAGRFWFFCNIMVLAGGVWDNMRESGTVNL
jgi:hypothetical protein